MDKSDNGQNVQKNGDNQHRIWNVSYTAIAVWCWLITVVIVRLWVYGHVPDIYRAQVFVESILTLAIVDVIVVHAIMYYKQAKEINKQSEIALKQFEATDRPWIKFEVEFTQPLTFNSGGGLQTQFKFTARNVGRSVAVNTTINTRLAVPEWSANGKAIDEILRQQREVCQQIDSALLSYAVFPGDDYTVRYGFGLIGDDVKRGELGDSGLFFLCLVGCVDYQFAGHDRHHQTRFAYEVVSNVAMKIGEDVPLESLKLRKLFFGGDYAD